MAAGPNPVADAMRAMLMQKLAGGGATASPGAMAMGGPGAAGPAGSPGDAVANASFGKELSSLRQADPMAMAQTIKSIHDQITTLISQAGQSVPGVSRALAKTLQGLGAAIKEAQTAASTMQVATPIQASAAQGAPGMGGMPAPGPSMGGM